MKNLALPILFYCVIQALFSCAPGHPANKKINTLTVTFPVEAKPRHFPEHEEDTLSAVINKINYIITPAGKLLWGSNPADTIHLQTTELIDAAYLYKKGDMLLVFYTETDTEGATSRAEKIDLTRKKQIWTNEILGFNLGVPYLMGNFAYVTTIGTVGKLNLNTGKYVYKFADLYDHKKFSFNSFDTIMFKGNLTLFLAKNTNNHRVDSLIVNEKTGITVVKK